MEMTPQLEDLTDLQVEAALEARHEVDDDYTSEMELNSPDHE